jgi:hypothetical protein
MRNRLKNKNDVQSRYLINNRENHNEGTVCITHRNENTLTIHIGYYLFTVLNKIKTLGINGFIQNNLNLI